MADVIAGTTLAGDKRYRAFISYSQKDKPEARKLQTWLETYRIPKTLSANAGRKLGRFFRDEEDLSGAADLGEALKQNIDASDSLIVLCSPSSAKSPWVDREIQHFRSTGRGGKVFAVILSGEPNSADPATECFPPSFRTSGASHDPSAMPLEPLAVNLAADGRERGATRLAAGLLEAPFDDLWRRERRRQQARTAFAGGLFVTGLGLLAAAVVAGSFAVMNLNEAERQQALAIKGGSDIITRQAMAIDATGFHETALLMTLQADPAAARLGKLVRHIPERMFPLARAQLAASFEQSRLAMTLSSGQWDYSLPRRWSLKSLAFSRDGKRVAAAFDEAPFQIWDVASGKPVFDLTDDSRTAPLSESVMFSPDGKAVLAMGQEFAASIWDAATGALIVELQGKPSVEAAVFSSDGRGLVTSSGDGVTIWDPATGKPVMVLPVRSAGIIALDYSRDEARIFGFGYDGDGEALFNWDVATGRLLRRIEVDAGAGFAKFSPDGRRFLTGFIDYNKPVRVWDAETGKEMLALVHPDDVEDAAFSPDGKRIATVCNDGLVRVWDVETGIELLKFAGHDDPPGTIAWSKNNLIASADFRQIRLWYADPQDYGAGESQNAAVPLAGQFFPDGKRLVETDDRKEKMISVREIATGKALWSYISESGDIKSASLSQDGKMLAIGARNLRVLNTSNHADVFSPIELGDSEIWASAFSPDGKRLAIGTSRGIAQMLDAESGRVLFALGEHSDSVISLSFSADGRRIAVAFMDGRVLVRDATDGRPYSTIYAETHRRYLDSAALSPDGSLMATSTFPGSMVDVWDTTAGVRLFILAPSMLETINKSPKAAGWSYAGFTEDGKHIVTWAGASGAPAPMRRHADLIKYWEGNRKTYDWTVPKIVLADVTTQIRMACEKLWKAGAPLAFTQADVRQYPVLRGELVDEATGDLVSPCKSVLPDGAFAKPPAGNAAVSAMAN